MTKDEYRRRVAEAAEATKTAFFGWLRVHPFGARRYGRIKYDEMSTRSAFWSALRNASAAYNPGLDETISNSSIDIQEMMAEDEAEQDEFELYALSVFSTDVSEALTFDRNKVVADWMRGVPPPLHSDLHGVSGGLMDLPGFRRRR